MFTIFTEKHLHISGPSKFKPMLFKSQLCIFYIVVLRIQNTFGEEGLQKKKREYLYHSYFSYSILFKK